MRHPASCFFWSISDWQQYQIKSLKWEWAIFCIFFFGWISNYTYVLYLYHCTCIYIYKHICTYIHIYIYIFIFIHIYIYIYTSYFGVNMAHLLWFSLWAIRLTPWPMTTGAVWDAASKIAARLVLTHCIGCRVAEVTIETSLHIWFIYG